MKNYNYILLDWDGCLAKTLDIWLQAYKDTFAEYGVYPDEKYITHEVFVNWDGMTKLVPDKEEYIKKLVKRLEINYPYVELYDNVRETLEKLKSLNKKIALITSSKKKLLGPALTNQKLNHEFDLILTADDILNHKPDPEIIFKALNILHGEIEESIIIGDSISDLGAGKNAKIDSLLFYPKHNEKFYDIEFLKKYSPTYIVNDFRNILDYVN